MSILRVLDVETSGTEATDEVVEIGIVHLNIETGEIRRFTDRLFGASKPLPPEVRAVHHISDEMLKGKPLFKDAGDETIHGNAWFAAETVAFGAHNAAFEAKFIDEKLRRGLPLLCSYKCALRRWPEAPKHSNQALRYWLNLDLDPKDCDPPHRSLPDAWVTAHIFRELFRQGVTLQEMIEWSAQPPIPYKCHLKKHKGELWNRVPSDYLGWIIREFDDDDLKWLARHILDRRKTYMEFALAALGTATTVENLRDWFAQEKEAREAIGILPETDDYERLVNACVIHRTKLETKNDDQDTESLPTKEPTNHEEVYFRQ